MTSSGTICRRCGKPVPADAPQGHCPGCVATAVFEAQETWLGEDGGGPVPVDTATRKPQATRVRGYELFEELGRGGMGIVYRARQPGTDRFVALKLLNVGLAVPGEATQRFAREARMIAGLDHPGIVRLYHVGNDQGHPFFTMELVEGKSLEALAREGPVTTKDAGRYLAKIARAVAYAHEHQVVHRDLKPSNILVDSLGEPRVTDFGIARQLDAEPWLTLTGQVMGTPGYMAPEQMRGGNRATEARSDVYSLGAMLYRLLSGRPPFVAETVEAMLLQVAEVDPVPVRRLNPSVPRDLEAICLMCIEKDPASRYPTATALAEDLDRFLDHEPVWARPITPANRLWRRCRRRPVVAALGAALAVVVLSGAAGVLWQWRSAVAARWETQQANDRLRGMLSRNRLEQAENLVRQGQPEAALPLLARILRDDPRNPVAPARTLSALSWHNYALPARHPIATTSSFNGATLSPDGQFVAVASWERVAQVYDLASGHPVTPPLRHDEAILQVAFSPSGQWLASSSPDGTVRVWEAKSGDPICPPLPHPGTAQHVTFSPDGTRLATTGDYPGERPGAYIHLWELPSGRPRFPALTNAWYFYPVQFSPDGRRMLAGSTDKQAHLWEADTGRIVGFLKHDSAVTCGRFSSDGERIATGSADRTARLWDAKTLRVVGGPLQHAAEVVDVQFSGDGKRLLTASVDGMARVFEVATGQLLFPPLVSDGGLRTASFDGEEARIITGGDDGTARVWDAATGLPWCAPLKHEAPVRLALFTADGNRIVSVARDGLVRVWDGRPGALRPVRLRHDHPVVGAVFGTDATEVIVATRHQPAVRWQWRQQQVLAAGPQQDAPISSPVFSSTTRRALIQRGFRWELWDTGGSASLLAEVTPKLGEAPPQFSRDGRWLVVNRPDHLIEILDAQTGQPLPHRSPDRPRDLVESFEFSDDARLLFVGGNSGEGQVWEIATGRLLFGFRTPAFSGSVRFSPDSTRIAASVPGRAARVFDLHTGHPVAPGMPHPDVVREVRFGHDGDRLVTVAADNAVRIWNIPTAELLCPPMRHRGPIQHLELSPDERSILTVAGDQSVVVWDATTGQQRFAPIRSPGAVATVRFLPEGDRWIMATEDGTAVVRETATGQALCDPMVHGDSIHGADLSRDGRALLLAGTSNVVSVWELMLPPTPAPAWLADLAEAVAGERLDEKATPVRVPTDELFKLKSELARSVGEDLYHEWARWFCGDRAERPPGPLVR